MVARLAYCAAMTAFPIPLSPERIAVVIPALNEALRIRDVVEGALRHCPNVILVDDGSDDGTMNTQWQRNTSDNVNVTTTTHRITEAGVHVLKFWMVDPTVVLQNLVVDTGGLKPSYLGPPESLRLR